MRTITGLPNLAICGRGRAGKDTAADWLAAHTPLSHPGSVSTFLAPYMAAKLGLTVEEAFARRHEDREAWFAEGNRLRALDPGVLVRAALSRGHMLVGCRDRDELVLARKRGLLDLIVWVENPRAGHDPTMTYDASACDVTIANDGDYPLFYDRLSALMRFARIELFDVRAP